ncbi:hypothetical protein Poly30_50640 [Planctomycetes bacterium Poly30]|uniref:SnoaL-like domain-containing protein n=1 Tax=Saltatorellus ferox TaxID=2528018 RepID=A0A518EZI9_9BACT|nr:hypothetical protein Poly30_50640 [Planctomycetes bacterium Poly30]
MKVADSVRRLLGIAACVLIAACHSAAAPGREAVEGGADPQQRLGKLIDDLYVAFSFDAEGGPDEAFLRSVFADGATFVSPPSSGESPKGVGADAFLADFQAFIDGSPLAATGYHERVISESVDLYGSIAHAWVTFEAFVPGEDPDRRGVDSLQFVLDGGEWKLVSFTTQYESDSFPIPRRFLPRTKLPPPPRHSPSRWPDPAGRARLNRVAPR